MKESVLTSVSWLKSNLHRFSHQNKHFFDKVDIHVHFPAAAIKKDGPSAGITITTALVSLLTGRKVKSNIAMTGEMTLKGLVLPVGGIKKKCLGVFAQGIRVIILPF